MKEQILQLFETYPGLAIFISLFANVLIAVLGVVPSFFLTAANLLFFGFWKGVFISFLGEALGAAVAFLLYRKGFRKATHKELDRFPRARKLMTAKGRAAFLLILGLRLLPFVPSGLVTFAAAIGQVSFPLFLCASSVGKLPALLLEAYAVFEIGRFGWQGKIILGAAAAYLLFLVLRKQGR